MEESTQAEPHPKSHVTALLDKATELLLPQTAAHEHLEKGPQFAHLLPPNWTLLVQTWLNEDLPSMDIGGYVVGEKIETATLFGKSDGLLAGQPFFEEVFRSLQCTVEWNLMDGDRIDTSAGKVAVAKVTGRCRHILLGERTALNALTRCSGVATLASEAVALAERHGWKGHVAGTRKTTPGFRLVEKYGLVVGGAATHRQDLSQMVMLKDNHIASAGSITQAVKTARRATGFSMKVEVETSGLEDAREAADAGADVVMIDNASPDKLKEVAACLKRTHPHVLIEASGGITALTMADYFSEHVDIISCGALTQGYKCLDFSLKITPTEPIV